MRINARAHSLWGTAICVAAIPAFATGTVKGMGVLEGTLVIVDPDDFADGTDMSNAVRGVTLSAIGSTPLTSAVFSDANSFGGQIFGHDGNFEPFWGLVTPSFDASLRADFTVPTDFVSVDFLMNNGFDPGILRAFNAADELIGEVELPGTAGAGNIETAEISSPIANIAYMIASTPEGTDVFLDRLTFNPGLAECLTVTDEDIDCHADGSTFTYTVQGVDGCSGGMNTYTFTASGGAVGEEMCFTVLVGDGGFCCTTEICVTIPDCTASAVTIIDFDELSNGDVVTNQFSEATFSSSAGNVIITAQPKIAHTPPNFICTAPLDSIPCVEDTFVAFTDAVNSLTFWAIGVNDFGTVAEVNVFVGDVFDTTVDITGLGDPFTPFMVDLSLFSNVTRIELVNITDLGGIGWDTFSFSVMTALPSDLDGDGIVGMVDFLALLEAWGSCSDCGNCPGDFDGDCSVGILDLLILLGNWG